MKGNPELIQKLDQLLAEELTAINQYVVHAEMCDNWGYDRLHEAIEKRAVQEMKHAEKLIARIIFLEGSPTVSKLNPIHIGQEVPKQFQSDLESEHTAVRLYNEAIHIADQANDAATRDLLESILNEEDQHVDWLEEQQDQIKQIGAQLYLAEQIRE
jgi:bacterioferritin